MRAPLNHLVHPGPAGPALLLVHPLGADLHFWDECAAAWQHRFASVACDLRDAGRSPRGAEPVAIAQHVEDLEGLRRALGLAQVIPVGCAIGAMVAAAYAAAHPAATAALVLASPTHRTAEAAAAMLAERATLVRRAGMAAILPGAVDKAFEQQPRDERYRGYLARFAAQDPQAYAASIDAILDADVTTDLRAVRCPTLVVAAAHDLLLPPAQARLVHGLVPHAQFALMEDAAHFAPFQRPEGFAGLVLSFLARAGIAPTHFNERSA
jgi:3-oxoadipate enol-lactonase